MTPNPTEPQPPEDRFDGPEGGVPLPMGHRLQEYVIEGLIGEGGFSIVYLARDTRLQRQVALKEYIPASLARRRTDQLVTARSDRYREVFDRGLRSFVNEAQLLASFDHPALVRVYRFWEENGTAYMAMPYVRAPTLKSWLQAHPRQADERWLRHLIGSLIDALDLMHAGYCYHRDIAPDNILLVDDGGARGPRPMLLDLGAARRVVGDPAQALTVILKPGYAPIEQYSQTGGMRQGPWTDVYGLCAVVYAAITGTAPIPAVSRVMHDALPPAAQAGAGRFSRRFLEAVDVGLALRPEQRPQSMGEFKALLGDEDDAAYAGTLPAWSIPRDEAPPTVVLDPRSPPAWHDPPAAPHPAPIPFEKAVDERVLPPGARQPHAPARPAAPQRPPPPRPSPPPQRPAAPRRAAGDEERFGVVPARMLKPALWVAGGVLVVGLIFVAGRSLVDRDPLSRAARDLSGQGPGGTRGSGPANGTGTASTGATRPATAAAQGPGPASPGAGSPIAEMSANPATLPTIDPAMPTVAATAPVAPAPPPSAPAAVLRDALRLANPDLLVVASPERPSIVIGRDPVRLRLQSAQTGYVYLYMAGTDGRLYLLFPNRIESDNRIEAGQAITLPKAGWNLVADGPPGRTHLLALVTESPRDISGIPMRTARAIPDVELRTVEQLWRQRGSNPLVGDARCESAAACREGFGAALVHIDEVVGPPPPPPRR